MIRIILHHVPRLIVMLFSLSIIAGCPAERSDGSAKPAERIAVPDPFEARSRSIVSAMDNASLAGQVLMVGVNGLKSPSTASATLLREVRPGAVLLFGFNLSEDPRIVAGLCEGLRLEVTSRIPEPALPPFIAVDHEGGPVYRFKGGLTRLPSAWRLGHAGKAAALAAGTAAGTELRAVGISMNLAPVVEALTSTNRAFLSDRAWSDDPLAAAALAGAFIDACQSAGVAAVAKHFPGNAEDPHTKQPVLDVSRTELERVYLAPFAAAARRGVAAVMLSHARVPALDPDRPVTVSADAVAELKDGLGFRGIVLSDDLVMAAIARPGAAGSMRIGGLAVAAMLAGVDMLMVSGGNDIREVWIALQKAITEGSLPRARLEDAAFRIVYQKLRFGLVDESPAERASRLDALPALVESNGKSLAEALKTEY